MIDKGRIIVYNIEMGDANLAYSRSLYEFLYERESEYVIDTLQNDYCGD